MTVRPCMGTELRRRCANYALPGQSRCQECLQANRPFVTGSRGTSPEWAKLRFRALARDGHRCVDCGVTADTARARDGKGLHVHHINLNPNDDRLENLVSLCRPCHEAKHAHNSHKGHFGRLSRFALPPLIS